MPRRHSRRRRRGAAEDQPDWPGRVADDLDVGYGAGSTVVFAGALGRTGPRLPASVDHGDDVATIQAYGDLLVARVDRALHAAQPVLADTVRVVDATLREEVSNPVIVALFADPRPLARLDLCEATSPLVVVATGPFVGEGFDCAALDALFLASPSPSRAGSCSTSAA